MVAVSPSFWQRAEAAPDALAVVPADGRPVTAGELLAASTQFEEALAAAGLRPGRHVALLLPNSPAMLAAVLGAVRSGLYAIPINTHLAPAEVRYIVEQ